MEPDDDRDAAYEAAQHEDAMRGAERELIDIIERAQRSLSSDEVAMLCWGCGIDKRRIQALTRR